VTVPANKRRGDLTARGHGTKNLVGRSGSVRQSGRSCHRRHFCSRLIVRSCRAEQRSAEALKPQGGEKCASYLAVMSLSATARGKQAPGGSRRANAATSHSHPRAWNPGKHDASSHQSAAGDHAGRSAVSTQPHPELGRARSRALRPRTRPMGRQTNRRRWEGFDVRAGTDCTVHTRRTGGDSTETRLERWSDESRKTSGGQWNDNEQR